EKNQWVAGFDWRSDLTLEDTHCPPASSASLHPDADLGVVGVDLDQVLAGLEAAQDVTERHPARAAPAAEVHRPVVPERPGEWERAVDRPALRGLLRDPALEPSLLLGPGIPGPGPLGTRRRPVTVVGRRCRLGHRLLHAREVVVSRARARDR